jgi:hypothetical protein
LPGMRMYVVGEHMHPWSESMLIFLGRLSLANILFFFLSREAFAWITWVTLSFMECLFYI